MLLFIAAVGGSEAVEGGMPEARANEMFAELCA